MAPSNNTYEENIRRTSGRTFTISEAREFERNMLQFPTGTTIKYRWVDSKTKQPIAFSY